MKQEQGTAGSRPLAGALLRRAREGSHLTQAELASAVRVPQSMISMYESGRRQPSVRTLTALLEGAGFFFTPGTVGNDELGTFYRKAGRRKLNRQQLRSVALHLAVGVHLLANPETVLEKARDNVSRMRAENPDAVASWFSDWERLLDGPLDELLDIFVSFDEHAIDLRSVSPFAGVLTPAERWQVYKAFEVEHS